MSRYTGSLSTKIKKQSVEDIISFVKGNIYTKLPNSGTWSIFYGYDDMGMGYFIQFYNLNITKKNPEDYIDMDTLFDGLSGHNMAFILRKLCEPSRELMLNTDLAYLDMPF